VTVAEELHFGRAAARLYVSQPAVSKQIRRLEEQLGAPLFVRNSRNVVLTARGERLHADARRLLAIAQDLQRPTPPERIRVAHIFELTTSRIVADAFVRCHPQAELHEHTMHSTAQLRALLDQRLDVAILRITPRMLLEHPTGWQHRLLRLEPLVLVGARGDENEPTAGLGQRPLHVFGDPPESGTYNAHGQFLSALERELGVSMRWLGTPGAFSHCLTHLNLDPPHGHALILKPHIRP
jgi:DNA-binding transcriptional LysR family regulator